jgi:hypothetical protein
VALSACNRHPPIPTLEAAPGSIAVVAASPAERVAAGGAKRGVGWYPNVEVDGQDRLHIAYTDADVGDLYYAVSVEGASTFAPPELVDDQGAAGAFVRLALAPGGAPALLYHHQDEKTLRVAHRPADVPAMKAAGAEVDDQALDPSQARPLASGWVSEEIAFGEQAGVGGALHVDARGRAHVLYYVGGDRVRYARRPGDVPAWGAGGVGRWDKLDVDRRAGQSPLVISDLVALADGRVVASYCDWQVVHGHLRLAVRAPDAQAPFTVTAAVERPRAGIDGASSALLPRADGKVDVGAVRLDDGAVLVGAFDPRAPAPLAERTPVAPARGPAVLRRGADGTLWILTRDARGQGDLAAGLYLVEVKGAPSGAAEAPERAGATDRTRRFLLEKGTQDDPWMDLALRGDGRPVALWFSEEVKGLKLYAP